MRHDMALKILAIFIFCSSFAFGQNLAVLNVQGVVRDEKGGAVEDGDYDFIFNIYDVEEGGTAIWTDPQTLTVASGVYSANLGDSDNGYKSFDEGVSGVLAFDVPYFVGIEFNGDAEISPRIRLTSAPYALSLQGTDNIFPSSGNVGVNTPSPTSQLHVVGDAEIDGAISVTGDAEIDGAISVTGNAEIDGAISTAGNISAGEKIDVNRSANSIESKVTFNTNSTEDYSIGQAVDSDNLYVKHGATTVMSFDAGNEEVRVRNDLQVDGTITIGDILPFKIVKYELGGNTSRDSDGHWTTYKTTTVSSSNYFAAVIGVDRGLGGIDGTDQYHSSAFMYDTGTVWRIYSRVPGDTAYADVWVLYILKELVDGPTDWN